MYAKEFRDVAVKLVTEGGFSVYKATRHLGFPKSMFENCARNRAATSLGLVGAGQHKKKKTLISQGLLDCFVCLWMIVWCPEPGSNRHSLATEGF